MAAPPSESTADAKDHVGDGAQATTAEGTTAFAGNARLCSAAPAANTNSAGVRVALSKVVLPEPAAPCEVVVVDGTEALAAAAAAAAATAVVADGGSTAISALGL